MERRLAEIPTEDWDDVRVRHLFGAWCNQTFPVGHPHSGYDREAKSVNFAPQGRRLCRQSLRGAHSRPLSGARLSFARAASAL
jgi:hypothetical protein